MNLPNYAVHAPPPPIGWWVFPGSSPEGIIKFSAHKKPRWLTRKMMDLIFEFKWEDA